MNNEDLYGVKVYLDKTPCSFCSNDTADIKPFKDEKGEKYFNWCMDCIIKRDEELKDGIFNRIEQNEYE